MVCLITIALQIATMLLMMISKRDYLTSTKSYAQARKTSTTRSEIATRNNQVRVAHPSWRILVGLRHQCQQQHRKSCSPHRNDKYRVEVIFSRAVVLHNLLFLNNNTSTQKWVAPPPSNNSIMSAITNKTILTMKITFSNSHKCLRIQTWKNI